MRLRGSGLTWQEIDGELVILDLNRSVYLTTNGSGTVLAKLLVEERTADELAAALVQTYSIDTDTARRDVESFIKTLTDKGLLA